MKDSEEHKGIAEFVESTIKKLSSVQDVARRYASFVSLGSSSDSGKLFSSLCTSEGFSLKEFILNEFLYIACPDLISTVSNRK